MAVQPQYNLVARKDYEQDYAPIASARTPEQLTALMAAPTLKLTEDEVAALDAVSTVFA